jgi:hypothetical protein
MNSSNSSAIYVVKGTSNQLVINDKENLALLSVPFAVT